MLDNHTYNLINQLAQEQKSWWRIKHLYRKDAGDCQDCQNFWQKMEQDKEAHTSELHGLIKRHL